MYREIRNAPIPSAAFAFVASIVAPALAWLAVRDSVEGFFWTKDEAESAVAQAEVTSAIITGVVTGVMLWLGHAVMKLGAACATGAITAVVLTVLMMVLNALIKAPLGSVSPVVATIMMAVIIIGVTLAVRQVLITTRT